MHANQECYEIKLEGHVYLDWSASIADCIVQYMPEGQTILTGWLPDQTALHGVLMRIRDLGLTLLEVKRLQDTEEK